MLAAFAQRFRDTTEITGSLVALQRPLLPALAALGRRFGY
jgi:hypothetical protein